MSKDSTRQGQPRILDIAQELGLAKSTVSLALRGSPRVKPETTKKVLEVAERMNYHPDPLLSALSSRKVRRKSAGINPAVAVVLPDAKAGSLDRVAAQTLEDLGYYADYFYLDQYDGSPKELAKVLHARGVTSLLLPEHPRDYLLRDFPFDDFIAIQCGVARAELPVDVVRYNPFDTVRLCWEKFINAGCRKIGGIFLMHGPEPSSIDIKQRAAFRYFQEEANLNDQEFVPPLICRVDEFQQKVPQWCEKWKPQGVIGPWDGIYTIFKDHLQPSKERTGFIAVRSNESQPDVAGYLVNARHVQLAAIAHLHYRLHMGPVKSFNQPKFSLVVEPLWKPGPSFPE